MTRELRYWLEARFGTYPYGRLLFDPNGYAPPYVLFRARGTRAHVPVSIYDTTHELVPFTALTMPS